MTEEEIIEWLKERLDEGEFATAETFIHEVFEGHREYRDSADARISEYAEGEQTLKDEIAKLKARNYDLLQQVGVDSNGGDGIVVEETGEDGTVYHIDNLFEDNQKDEED